ncbi:MAG: hypothetical protein PHR83_17370 [Paludibacter sp.]|nr:hypothetical protein [Paludibacter sp.]
MKMRIKLSRLLQIGLLLTFLLPFFPQGCDPKQAENVPTPDSTFVAVDSLRQDSNELTMQIEKSDTLKTAVSENTTQNTDKTGEKNEDNELSTKISKKSTFLKFLLRPNNNYTGIASLIDFFSILEFGYGLGIAFILWLIALIIKFKDYNNIFILLNFVGLVSLFWTHSMYNVMSEKRLWGFWVCLIWGAIMIIYDCIILLKIRKERQKTST